MNTETLLRILTDDSSDDERTQVFEFLLNKDTCSRPVLLSMLQSYYRTRSSPWGAVAASPPVWSRALSKHLPAIVEELRRTNVKPVNSVENQYFDSLTLTKAEYSSLWHSFCYVAAPPAEEMFVSLVQDRAFLRNLTATDCCLEPFASWISYSSCNLALESVDAIVGAIEYNGNVNIDDNHEFDLKISTVLLRHLSDFMSSAKRFNSNAVLYHPKFVDVRNLIIKKLRNGLSLNDFTLRNLVSNPHANELSCVIDVVKKVCTEGREETIELALQLLERYLEEFDPVSTYEL
jgi:hypothetical protein